MEKHTLFLKGIDNKKCVKVKIDSEEKGIIIRTCIPFDYAISRRYKDGAYRYHFYDLDSPEGSHNLSVLPNKLLEIELLDRDFNPEEIVKWTPNWEYSRDWGTKS